MLKVKIYRLLLPFAWLYGLAVWVRNRLFDWKALPAVNFDIPVISIGNIAVGGTGKTPHTEYLIRLLREDYRVAMLSRGYRRATSGFVLAGEQTAGRDIGDEPYQIWRKFPDITVAVDRKRVHGIQQLLALPEEKRPEVILLDDAYQHRQVTPSLSLLLTDFHRLLTDDCLLPAGRLREPARNRYRAQMIIVTKCPEDIKPADCQLIEKNLKLHPGQSLFFSFLEYGKLSPVFRSPAASGISLEELKKKDTGVLLLTGIAHPRILVEMLSGYAKKLETKIYPDHHDFSKKELSGLDEAYRRMNVERKIIVTTEKDAARLVDNANVSGALRQAMYYLPVRVAFHDENLFKQKIKEHVGTVKRNRVLD
jgi:tetraacyldisaccharide 4'-kinase